MIGQVEALPVALAPPDINLSRKSMRIECGLLDVERKAKKDSERLTPAE